MTKKLNISGVVDIVKTAIGIDAGKKELGNTIQIKDALRAATYLELEVSISQQSPGGEFGIQLSPVDETFKKIERWEEVHTLKPDIDFPEEAVNSHDWYKIGEELYNMELKLEEDGTKIINYISSGNKGEAESVEALVNEIE